MVSATKKNTIAEEMMLPAALDMVDDASATKIKPILLSNDSVTRCIQDVANNLQEQLVDQLKDKCCALQFDEATDSNKDFVYCLCIF